jgi:hypothetical protein
VIVVEFPQPAPRLNLNQRHHFHAVARWKAAWRKAAWVAAVNTGHKNVGPSVVTIYLPVRDRRLRDGHNDYSQKPAIDGLVDAGFWPADDGRYVSTTEPVFVYGAKTVRIEVTPR